VNAIIASVLYCPAQVSDEEVARTPDGRKLRVVDEDDAALFQQPTRVEEIDEHALEAVVAVEEGKIELPSQLEQAGQHDLRLLGVELDQIAGATTPCAFSATTSPMGHERRTAEPPDHIAP